MAKSRSEIEDGLREYKVNTPWYMQWRLIFAALPLIVIMLAIALGITIGAAIAIICTDGNMPAAFQWLCYTL